MADIERRIRLYSQAFQLAREHIATDRALDERPGIAKELHDLIRREIAVGFADPVAIAAIAVREMQARGGAHR